jgi:lysyl oxidase
MSAPYRFHLDRSTIRGHVLLRAASSIDNLGSGPMELSFHRSGSKMSAYQAIYDVRGRRHLFPSRARLTFKYVPGERYGMPAIEAFSYWKLRHAAAFQLWSIDAHDRALQLVRTGPKVDYCLRDLIRTHPSAASPPEAVYPACSQDPYMRSDVLGTSVGWSDQYPYEYPEQWIDVTGLRGRFAYVQRVDPDGLLIESNHENDVSETYVELPSGRVLGHRVGVAVP